MAPPAGRTVGAPSVVTAAAGASAAAVVVAGGGGVALFCLHLTWSLSVSLCELDLDLAAADPLPVQAVHGVLSIPHILKLDVSKSSGAAGVEVQRDVDVCNRTVPTELPPQVFRPGVVGDVPDEQRVVLRPHVLRHG